MHLENKLNSAFASGELGLQRASSQVAKASSEIANGAIARQSGEFQPRVNVTENLLDLKVSAINAQASAKVLGVADGSIGTLLDIFA